jgi:hypothetical protein
MANTTTRAHRQILDFQNNASNDLASRKMVHTALVASIASPMVTRTLAAAGQPRARIAHSPYDLNPYDVISPEAAEKDKWREGPAQPFEKARFAKGKGDYNLDKAT